MKHVTFGTARKLKDAGFPQPEMERGQSWYSVNGHEILITGTSGKYAYGVDESNHLYKALSLDGLTFAPTATDILRELPPDWMLWHDKSTDKRPARFLVGEYEPHDGFGDINIDENPAEVAAKAFLAKAGVNLPLPA